MLYQCPLFHGACFALNVPAHRLAIFFAPGFHSRLVLVVGDIDTHFGGVVRGLVVGRLS
jgi:hypothetical protein